MEISPMRMTRIGLYFLIRSVSCTASFRRWVLVAQQAVGRFILHYDLFGSWKVVLCGAGGHQGYRNR